MTNPTAETQCKCPTGTWIVTEENPVPAPCEKFEAIPKDMAGFPYWDEHDCVICAHRKECHVQL